MDGFSFRAIQTLYMTEPEPHKGFSQSQSSKEYYVSGAGAASIFYGSAVGCVDIGTEARVPLNVVVYHTFQKVREIRKNKFDKVIAPALVTTNWVILCNTLYKGGHFFHNLDYSILVSKDAEF
jgi:hypothetical protein